MKYFNNCFVIGIFGIVFAPIFWVAAADDCELQGKKIKAAVKTCQNEFASDAYNEILSKIAAATLTVDELKTYTEANCAKIDEITKCVVGQKAALADETCNSNSVYNHAIFSLNHVIRLNLFVCGKQQNGEILLKAMIPQDGLKCFYGNEDYVNCVRTTESNSDLPDICKNIDVRLNCLRNANNCANPNAVAAFRNLFLLYKEKIVC